MPAVAATGVGDAKDAFAEGVGDARVAPAPEGTASGVLDSARERETTSASRWEEGAGKRRSIGRLIGSRLRTACSCETASTLRQEANE